MIKKIIIFILCCFSLYGAEKNILVIHSYHQSFNWTDRINSAILNTLQNDKSIPKSIYIEYMDAKRHHLKKEIGAFKNLILTKITSADIIITTDNYAFDFIINTKEFTSTPIVFCGLNGYTKDMIKNRDKISGVPEDISTRETLEVICSLQPSIKNVIVYSTDSPTGKANLLEFEKNKSILTEKKITVIYIKNLKLNEIEESIKDIDGESALLYIDFIPDENGNTMPFEKHTQSLCEKINIPVYTLWDFHLGYGVLGGKMISGEAQGINAAKLAIAYLNSKTSSIEKSPNKYMFDNNALKRFNISQNRLPKNSTLINEDKTLYEKHPILLPTLSISLVILLAISAAIIMYILELRKMHKIIYENENSLEATLQSISEAVIVFNNESVIIRINKAAEKYIQVDAKKVIGENISSIFAIEDREAKQIEFNFDYILTSLKPTPLPSPCILKTRGGGKIFINGEASVILAGRKRLGGVIVFRDISKQQEYIEKLEESEKRFRRFADGASDTISRISIPTGKYTYINNSIYGLTGYTPQEFYDDKSITYKIIHPDYHDKYREFIDSLSAGICEHKSFEYRIITKQGDIKWVYHRVSITDTKNPPHYFDSIISDITNIKENERKIEEYTQTLKRSNEDLEKFAYITSHDLQEPLRTISSYLSLLNKRYGSLLPPEGVNMLDATIKGAIRMRDIIVDLLEYSRLETSTLATKVIDTNIAVNETLRILSISIDQHAVVIQKDNLPPIKAPESLVISLFQNIISNSIKFRSEKQPVIKISAKELDRNVEFCVEDNGIGFDNSYAERIFDIFQRLQTRKHYNGTGIGLAVCKKIVQKLGGNIWAESEEGKGTKIFFTLPSV